MTSRSTPLDPRYEVQEEIGRGGVGVVFRVFDHLLGRHVAMKVLRVPGDARALQALRAEARTIARLDHPNIVPVYDVLDDADGETTRILMKLVDGRSLADILATAEVPPVAGVELVQLLQVFLKVCDAVAFAHNRGVIHRDLTPANVMVGDFGQVYVMDWGLAVLRESLASDGHAVMTPGSGTLAYMAPEQAHGRRGDVSLATDVFALGGILYHVLTLHPPWEGTTPMDLVARARKGQVPAPTSRVDVVLPAGLCRIAMKALAPEPGDRYPSVEVLRREVEAFLRGGGWFDLATYPRGTLVLRDGEPGVTAYIVVAGTCEIYRVVGGRKVVLRSVGPGEVFGEVAFFTESQRTATVEATSDVTVLVVTRAALERELEQSSWMRAFVKAAVERFAELDRREASRPKTSL
jgi:serine/threonine protein kinase